MVHRFGFTADLGTAELDPSVAQAAYLGVVDVIEVAGLEPAVDTTELQRSGSLTDIVKYFQLPNGQVDADAMFETLVASGFSSPENPKFLLISEDLKAANTNYIFGFSVKEVGLSVQSLARFKNLQTHRMALAARHIGRHEYGHLLGLDGSSVKNTDQRGGLYAGHCANVCTMQQVMSVPETVTLADRLSEQSLAGFCIDCVGSLRSLHES
jgi:predicted Zn-dependent protease